MKLSVVVPCYNEEATLEKCIRKLLEIEDDSLILEVIIVNDGSSDKSPAIAQELHKVFQNIRVVSHKENAGKGAALRTGFRHATGDLVAVQDADLEYDPQDLKRLIIPIIEDRADVVFGSRFLSRGAHRVFHFWHYMGNRFLTFISNMFTDLNLTDMETCYKVFKREIIEQIDIRENRFGFEPEIVAKVAHMRVRIFEMGISYYGRTYGEGKKIGVKDGFRALYCIFRYNAYRAPVPVQFLFYLFIGGTAALVNLAVFLLLLRFDLEVFVAAPVAFIFAAAVNYILCIKLLFRHRAKWNSAMEVFIYVLVVCFMVLLDLVITSSLMAIGFWPFIAKLSASTAGLVGNFIGRRFAVFPEPSSGPWEK